MILARIICLLPGIMLLPSGIGWLSNPAETSASFGFLFNDLSLAAQNALIRDLTAFFLFVPILCSLVVSAHIIAATVHGTGFIMEMFLPEVVILILSYAGTYLIAKQQN